jgi:hypothetical protein
MTNPPYGSDEQGAPEESASTGASPADPDRFTTQPTPTVSPNPPPAYGPAGPYGQTPPYGQPQPGPYGPPAYGQPQPQYVPGAQPQPYRPAQPGPYGYGQPQYGTPQYGASGQQFGRQPAPAEKSKVGLIALVTGGLLVVIAVVVVLVMSLQSTVLDPAAVERDVAAQFQEREGVAVELDCADDMEVVQDATYECTGTTADGESVTLRIAITDENSAAYTWTEP